MGLATLLPDAVFAHKPQRLDSARPKQGGIVKGIDDLRVELVAIPDRLALYLRDAHDRPVPLEPAQAAVLCWRGRDSSEIAMRAEAGRLVGNVDTSRAGPFRVIVRLSLPEREPFSILFGPVDLEARPELQESP